jgi:hypothetical protein
MEGEMRVPAPDTIIEQSEMSFMTKLMPHDDNAWRKIKVGEGAEEGIICILKAES